MDERLYSRPLDVHRISEYPEVQRMITYLSERCHFFIHTDSFLDGSPKQDKIPG